MNFFPSSMGWGPFCIQGLGFCILEATGLMKKRPGGDSRRPSYPPPALLCPARRIAPDPLLVQRALNVHAPTPRTRSAIFCGK